jgi:hypothetical protein
MYNDSRKAENIEAKERINFKNIHFEKWHKKRREAEDDNFSIKKMWQWAEEFGLRVKQIG